MNNFDFGIRMEYINAYLEPNVAANLDQYLDLRISQNIYTWELDQYGLPFFNKD